MRSTTALMLLIVAVLTMNAAAQESKVPEVQRPAKAQEVTPAKRITATYEASQISNIVLESNPGRVFFDAGNEHYCWELDHVTRAEQLQAAILMADKIAQAEKIETMRLEHLDRNYNRGTTPHFVVFKLALFLPKLPAAK